MPQTPSNILRRLALAMIASSLAGSAMAATLSGTASYRERIALPPDAVFEAVLQDVSLADARAVELGRATTSPAGFPPFHFTINYDDKAIVPGHRYAVRASVRHQGQLLFTTDTHIPAFGGSGPIDIRMVSVARAAPPAAATADKATTASTAPDSPLRNTYWKLTRLNDTAVTVAERQREPHLILSASELRLSGNGGCNGVMGGFEVEGDQLRFKGLASTMMACPQGMAQETQFLQALGQVTHYRVAGPRLFLFDAAGVPVAVFEAVALR